MSSNCAARSSKKGSQRGRPPPPCRKTSGGPLPLRCRWSFMPSTFNSISHSKIRAPERFVLAQLARRAARHDLARGNEVVAVRHLERFPQILLHKEHGDAERA